MSVQPGPPALRLRFSLYAHHLWQNMSREHILSYSIQSFLRYTAFSARRLGNISPPLILVPASEAYISATEADVVMKTCRYTQGEIAESIITTCVWKQYSDKNQKNCDAE